MGRTIKRADQVDDRFWLALSWVESEDEQGVSEQERIILGFEVFGITRGSNAKTDHDNLIWDIPIALHQDIRRSGYAVNTKVKGFSPHGEFLGGQNELAFMIYGEVEVHHDTDGNQT